MNTGKRLAGFGVALVAVLGTGVGLGAVVGPDVVRAEPEAPAPVGEGVVTTEEGYRLVPLATDLDPDGGAFRFVIEDQTGEPVHDFTALHERALHLITQCTTDPGSTPGIATAARRWRQITSSPSSTNRPL